LLGRLIERYRPRLAVIACNTASTIALDHARCVAWNKRSRKLRRRSGLLRNP
jgi:hypothetical protein